MFRRPWPLELSARQLLREGAAVAPRLSLVGLVRFDEVVPQRVAAGLEAELAERLVELHRPWVTEQYGADDLVGEFVRCQRLQAVSELRVDCNWLGDRGLAEVLASPMLLHLEELELAAGLQTVVAYEPLARRAMTRLRRFGLARPDDQDGDHRVGDDLAALLAGAGLAQLESLSLPRVALGPAGLARLFQLPLLSELNLAGSKIRDEGCGALASAPGLSRLRVLELEGCLGYDDAGDFATPGPGFSALVTSPRFAVKQLGLEFVSGAAAIVSASPRMTSVERLSLTMLDDDQLDLLIASPHFLALRELLLGDCTLSTVGLDALGSSRLLAGLERLALSADLDAEQQGLFSRRLPHLRQLELQANATTAESLHRADLPNLTELHLDFLPAAMSAIDDDELDTEAIVTALVGAHGLPRLTTVVTSGLAPEQLARLVERFGPGARSNNPR